MTLGMISYTIDERLALLLSVLGDDFAANALQNIDPDHGRVVEKLYREFKTDPPSFEELEFVVGDFMRYFDFAMEALDGKKAKAGQKERDPIAEPKSKAAARNDGPTATIYFPELTPSDDPMTDLRRLDAWQIFKAIDSDHPKTIAMVLRKIDVKQAAQVIELLNSETRGEVVRFMTLESTVPAPILKQVLKTTVQKACAVTSRPPEVDSSQTLAELMRSLPKPMRAEMMKQIDDADSGLAEKVKSMLYVFEDVLRLDDRDVQKLLGQIETDSLIMGLQQCDQALMDKLLNNLSRRVRETVVEEMDYKKGSSEAEINGARKQIVEALARMDEAGEIKL